MSSACSRKHQSYACFRLEVFQSLFGHAFVRYQTPSSPRNQLRNGRSRCRCFGSTTKLSKQRGSRNFEEDAELRAFMKERLVPEKDVPQAPMSTPAPSQQEPTKKPRRTGESTLGSPYRKNVQEDLKVLVHELRSAASKAQKFEEQFRTARPAGSKHVRIESDEPLTLYGKEVSRRGVLSDPEYAKFEEEFRTARPARSKHVKIWSEEPPMLRDVFSRHITLDPDNAVRRLSLDLPESPVMRRLRKVKKHKRAPTADELSALSENPWASILASPVRFCQATGVRLPSDLLVPWSFVRKRSTDLTYLMPAGLANMKDLKPLKESAGSQSPERSEDENAAQNNFVSAFPPSSKLMGKTTLLPYRPLIQRMTEKMVRRDTQCTNNGAVHSVLNNRVKVAFDEAQHYAEGPEERNRMNPASLKWDPDISTRMMGIMRERVLTALESLGVLNDSQQGIVPVPVKALETGRMVVLVGPTEGEAASLTYSFRVVEAMPEPSPRVPSRKFAQLIQDRYAGSFLLHINSAPVVVPDQPAVVSSGLAPNLIPQTISMNNTIRFPVFNLQQMMGFREWDGVATEKVALRYKEVLQSSKFLDVPKSLAKGGQPLVQEQDFQDRPAYLLFVSSRPPMASILAKELWQLWRYQGGSVQEQNMMPMITADPDAAKDSAEPLGEVLGESGTGSGQPMSVWREQVGKAPVSISA